MVKETHFSLRTGVLLIVIGLFIFVLFLFLFGVNPFQVAETLKTANPFYYSLAFGALLLSVSFYSLTWHRLLNLLSVKTSLFKAFQFIWIGDFVNQMIPAESVSGDITRVYLMCKESSDDPGKVVASVMGHRILSTVITFGGFLVSAVYFVLVYSPSLLVIEFIAIVTATSIVSLSLLIYLSIRKQSTEKIVNWVVGLLARISHGHWKVDSLKSSAEKMLNAFHEGIQTLIERPKKLISPLFFSFVAWLFDLLIAVMVFLSIGSLGVTISFPAIVIVYSIIIGIQNIPIGVPGEVGVVEIAMTALYTLLGSGDPIVMSAIATSATLLIRILTLWTRLIIGGIAFQWLGIKGFSNSARLTEPT
jgi:uncharacterized protein (TIRG00374 family)